MKRALAAVAVVALVIVGYLMFRKHKTADTTSDTTASSSSGSSASGDSRAPTVTPAPSLPDNGGAARLPEGSANEYVVGDVRIRDHRSGSNAPIDVPPNVHPPGARQIPSTLTSAMSQQVRGVLKDCTKDIPRETRGPHPRLEGRLIVTIKDHKMSVTSAAMQLRDMPEDSLDATRQCVEQHSVGLETEAADQDDLDNYSIGVTFAVL